MQASDQFLTFFLAGEEYAITVLKVTEIIECGALTKVPGAPASIRGVINLRGAVVPVVDLAIKFGLPETAVTARSCIVVVELPNEEERLVLGVMADAVHQVLDLLPAQIQPPPSFGPKVRIDCILGMATSNGAFIVLLDIDKVLLEDAVGAMAAEASGEFAMPEAAGIAPDLDAARLEA